jgi:hypothetical protein
VTPPTNVTLTAIGRQLSAVYLPTVQEPLPRELKGLVLQLVARTGEDNNLNRDFAPHHGSVSPK